MQGEEKMIERNTEPTAYKTNYRRKKSPEGELKEKTLANIRTGHEEGKTIALDKLPECKHKKMLLQLFDDTARVCVIACRRGLSESWVSYIGYPDLKDARIGKDIPLELEWLCENVHTVEAVKMLGEILEKKAAVELFPEWSGRLYKAA